MAPPKPAQDVNERLSATLEAILQRLNRPQFGATTLRARIMGKLRKAMTLLVIVPS